MNKNNTIAIMGPTATGKTKLGVQVAKELNGEIISVDSALVYLGMDIGTAKPSLEERDGIVHHLIDIRDPSNAYSAADFVTDAKKIASDIIGRGKVPIFVGGTMLYFKALIEGLSILPETDPLVRKEVNELINKNGLSYIREKLKAVDPDSYERINSNDSQRTSRAYEIYLMSGRSMTDLLKEQKAPDLPFDINFYAVLPDKSREMLKPLIFKRFQNMLDLGFQDEVEKLYQRKDLSLDTPAIKSVGYRQMWQFLEGKISYDEMRNLSVIATCQLAKRQMTWIRGWKKSYTKLDMNCSENVEIVCKDFRKK